eukprot:gene13722-15153_t
MPRLYVGRIPNRVSERDVEKFFKGYGHLREINLKNGYGFVDFEDYRDADDAVYDLNGKEMMGERIIIEHARGTERGRGGVFVNAGRTKKQRALERYGPPLKTKYKLVVENLSSRVSWQDLKDYCRQAGDVTYADAHKRKRGEAVICLSSYDDMKNVIQKLDGTELNGKKIRFVEDSRYSRSRSRSRSNSRRRKRSYSRSKSPSYSRSRSRSPRRSFSNSPRRSRSVSPRRSRSKSAQRSSRSHSRQTSSSRSHSISRSRSPSLDKMD